MEIWRFWSKLLAWGEGWPSEVAGDNSQKGAGIAGAAPSRTWDGDKSAPGRVLLRGDRCGEDSGGRGKWRIAEPRTCVGPSKDAVSAENILSWGFRGSVDRGWGSCGVAVYS